MRVTRVSVCVIQAPSVLKATCVSTGSGLMPFTVLIRVACLPLKCCDFYFTKDTRSCYGVHTYNEFDMHTAVTL